jgi:hypothetical protein
MNSGNDGFLKILKSQDFEAHIEQDSRSLAFALDKHKKIEEVKDKGFEKSRSDVLKRALLLIGEGNPKITSTDNSKNKTTKMASENGLPNSFYITHGSRNLITIPRSADQNPDKLINWLISGKKDKKVTDYSVYSQKDALKKDKLLYVRSAATHGVKFDDGGIVIKETKGFWIGASDFLKNCWKVFANAVGSIIGKTPYPITSHHFGIDYSLEYNSPIDSKDHGHLYLYYQAPTKDKEGVILIGMEGAAPDSPKHSKTGASDPMSPTNSLKYRDLKSKATDGVVVPDTVDSLRIDLNDAMISNLTNIDNIALDKIDNVSIVRQVPNKEFVKNLTKDALPDHAQNLHPNQQQSHYFADKVEKSQGVVQNSLSN